ncbi:uncharacterized protein MELLADRAFT_75319 [Melampsora larici-populina 98AG31]|uniref:CREG-like beta-barrel domain-containing protein n=1 Tax=Melampsora larici-populina (strain 98AG31 / pathotype 3-4-7) TaxID=747676 RepID=F4RW17_MELLP|nr:uncharacterized protein MELLADRAFT_75319 [Melampsora larici-populina 98AG31]EGG03459.1 hypothetical protein MELLADRAFT_75319 [Melampsora larici-populina 98AG31]
MLFKSFISLFTITFWHNSNHYLTRPRKLLRQTSNQIYPSLSPSLQVFRKTRETLSDAALHARELIQYRSLGIGTLMSTYPEDHPQESLRGLAIGLQEYFAPYHNGDLLLLALPISPIYKNIDQSSSLSATIAIKDELGQLQRNGSNWAANRRRITLFGTLMPVTDVMEAKALYEKFHPDSSFWNGDNGPHDKMWVRFQTKEAYYFGGFGDRAAIGWLDMELYQNEFKDTIESKTKSVCFHPYSRNLYCDQAMD